ncbi:YdaS family helix-turn-helix protein [Wielerella bovis]|uniref:YdaS family helix-turn-helix protein n=1 Tax=Wielerella bovis TaxID=2917790 RepID=UPI002018A629|nr:YdaS family helix-turn-helix protein [Wielerella bovis]MCG7657151.1 helix-turn-helix domain-containing protein [Wielerella bovis]MCG7659374.1 helix-turn-helix domain-containing protein [Wielerella bovis]
MNQDKIEADRKLIAELGGNTVLAKLIGVTPQRVCNWKSRGIPPGIKIDFPEIFLQKKETAENSGSLKD